MAWDGWGAPVGEPIPTVNDPHRIEMHAVIDIWSSARDGCSRCRILRAHAMPYIVLNLMVLMSGVSYLPRESWLGIITLSPHAWVFPERTLNA